MRELRHTRARQRLRIFQSAAGTPVKRKQNGTQSATRACLSARVHTIDDKRATCYVVVFASKGGQWEMPDAT